MRKNLRKLCAVRDSHWRTNPQSTELDNEEVSKQKEKRTHWKNGKRKPVENAKMNHVGQTINSGRRAGIFQLVFYYLEHRFPVRTNCFFLWIMIKPACNVLHRKKKKESDESEKAVDIFQGHVGSIVKVKGHTNKSVVMYSVICYWHFIFSSRIFKSVTCASGFPDLLTFFHRLILRPFWLINRFNWFCEFD